MRLMSQGHSAALRRLLRRKQGRRQRTTNQSRRSREGAPTGVAQAPAQEECSDDTLDDHTRHGSGQAKARVKSSRASGRLPIKSGTINTSTSRATSAARTTSGTAVRQRVALPATPPSRRVQTREAGRGRPWTATTAQATREKPTRTGNYERTGGRGEERGFPSVDATNEIASELADFRNHQ